MKVDIILVSYNQEQYIAQAVESILMQRVNEDVQIRVIVADDSSTDRTVDIIRDLDAKQYEKIIDSSISKTDAINMCLVFQFVYLDTETNLGISKNYHRAFGACSADYVAVLEGDDYWSSPYHIEQHIRFLDRHRECSMSMNTITYMKQESSEFIAPSWWHSDEVRYVDTKTQIASGNQLGNLSACVFRNSCIQKLPKSLFDIPIADWMLGVMLSQQGLIAILKESTSVYRTNLNSKWASLTPKQQRQRMIDGSILYDNFQDRKYHAYWNAFRKKTHDKIYLTDFIPPIIFLICTYSKKLLKYLCPPIIKILIKK